MNPMESMTNTETRLCLVDACHGVYCWKNLAKRYPLFNEEGEPLADEALEGLKGEEWCEWVDWLEPVYVKHEDGRLWLVEQDDDIFAVNPDAEWDDEAQDYVLPGPKTASHERQENENNPK